MYIHYIYTYYFSRFSSILINKNTRFSTIETRLFNPNQLDLTNSPTTYDLLEERSIAYTCTWRREKHLIGLHSIANFRVRILHYLVHYPRSKNNIKRRCIIEGDEINYVEASFN